MDKLEHDTHKGSLKKLECYKTEASELAVTVAGCTVKAWKQHQLLRWLQPPVKDVFKRCHKSSHRSVNGQTGSDQVVFASDEVT